MSSFSNSPLGLYAPGSLLLVDEHGPVADAVRRVADAADVQWQHASSIEDAVARMSIAAFEVVVLNLSGPTGLDALTHFTHQPVAIVGVLDDAAKVDEAMQQGAHEVVLRGALDDTRLAVAIRTSIRLAESELRAQRAELGARDLERRMNSMVNARGATELGTASRMASLGELAAGVVHEINNPLTYVLFNIAHLRRTLASQSTDSGVTRSIDEIAEGAGRIRDLVWKLKAFSDSGADTVVPLQMSAVLDEAINMADSEIRYRCRIERRYQAVPKVLGNDQRLIQVFVNLLLNAAQAFDGRLDQDNVVTVTVSSDTTNVWAEIADNGPGIPADKLARLIDPFFGEKADGQKGTGLGLSIAHNVVSGAGGSLTIESEVGQGTVVRVGLPHNKHKVSSTLPPMGEGGRAGRILAIDEDPSIGRVIRLQLSPPYEVEVVLSGAEAVGLLESGEKYDLILCDLNMPGMTGMDVFEWVRHNRPDLVRHMAFITGGAFTPRANKFVNNISNPVFEKPFDVDTFAARVSELLDRLRDSNDEG